MPNSLNEQLANARREVKEHEARGMTNTYWHDKLKRLETAVKEFESEVNNGS